MWDQAWALVGVLVGAVLAGGASLLLAWRQETVEARAGVQVVMDILGRAHKQLDERLKQAEPLWWRPGVVPATEPWPAYRRALTARLPRATIAQVEEAMARLDGLNFAAARATERSDEFDARVWDAIVEAGNKAPEPTEATTQQDSLRLLRLGVGWFASHRKPGQPQPPSSGEQTQPFLAMLTTGDQHKLRRISDAQRPDLRDAFEQFERTRAALATSSPARLATDVGPLKRLAAWMRWHKRPLAALALAVAVAFALIAWPRPESSAQQLERTLAAHLQGAALTACEPIEDHATRFSCIAVTQENHASCIARTLPDTKRVLIAGLPVADDTSGCGKGAIAQALEWVVTKADTEDCADYALTKAAYAASPAEQARPGWRARLLKQLRRGIGQGIAAGELPDVLVPNSVVPGASFVGC